MSNRYKGLVAIIPCMNEADNLGIVINKLRSLEPVAIIVGLDPATTDATKQIATDLDCVVTNPTRSGYDAAVSIATKYALKNHKECLLLYTDAGNKYGYGEVPKMVALIRSGYDIVMGIRTDALKTMKWHQKFGTVVIQSAINILMRENMRDISPFRLVHPRVFEIITMTPKKFRWPSEMLVKSLACRLKVGQIDVVSLPRHGNSKVSGSFMNSFRAGIEMFSSLKFYNYERAK